MQYSKYSYTTLNQWKHVLSQSTKRCVPIPQMLKKKKLGGSVNRKVYITHPFIIIQHSFLLKRVVNIFSRLLQKYIMRWANINIFNLWQETLHKAEIQKLSQSTLIHPYIYIYKWEKHAFWSFESIEPIASQNDSLFGAETPHEEDICWSNERLWNLKSTVFCR